DKCVYDEIIPTLTLPKKELEAFAAAVGERFNNPFIDHSLLAIALNSTSKWKARVLPSLKAFVENTGKLPLCLTLSLAALIEFYRKETGKNAKDDAWILEFYAAHQNADNTTITKAVLTNEKMWDEDLTKITGLEKAVIKALDAIDKDGMYAALKSTL
ncbi:MAG: tagaturonate reductase, partial [Oscillospiraceae bacterium]